MTQFLHPSGHELFYRSLDGLIAVATTLQPTFQPAKPEVLFEDTYVVGDALRYYDVSRDGRHFLMLEESEQAAAATHFNLVLNWFEELKRLVPPK